MSYCTAQDIIEIVRELDLSTIKPQQQIFADVPLSQQGVDSLDKMNIFMLLEEKYEIKIPDEDFDDLNTFTMISDYINQTIPNC
ncbi:phosphopantetheine-binding protein [Anabaenopsis tanganyikae CS-531]|uniref:Phosphopantetheine-binding protein n=2 Tax=Anabaenopsis TaxID=110103 RepID=A0ABT5ANN1_9CYAN|nr:MULTISPECIES: phosphopantetheine-binding protein [Anabaenopsis]MDB9538494.1 phosphopantetheine-binding protein [Anabaenopsis arnoldii]MDH6090767.1 phosphopantetheine-binding protein [Anabaenopsis arnoldii]MDH6107628.1 phosphopantetheine-binding protein [Anabaenopsis tanganyikae CS-531]